MSNTTIQSIFKAYESYLNNTAQPLKNRKAIYGITHCRTEKMGTSYFSCEDRHTVITQHHSCRHRSCYLCAQKKRLEWIDAQRHRLFDVPHFHVVFTLPHEYLNLWRYNESLFSQLIFKASQQTLMELVRDEQHHGITPGILMVLHTWGRQLTLHPHTHCLVTAGGLNTKGDWQESGEFLLPIRVVKKYYRGKMQALIKAAYESGDLTLPDDMDKTAFERLYKATYKKEWSVRIEERYEHGKGVMLYLARYLKGGPLNPSQIQSCTSEAISFRYLDHRDKRRKTLSLSPQDFLKRFLEHVPVIGQHTVRFYGLYATSSKARHTRCVEELGNLQHEKVPGLTLESMLLFCTTCNAPARLTHRVWGGAVKGNSINKGAHEGVAPTLYNKINAADVANAFHKGVRQEIPP